MTSSLLEIFSPQNIKYILMNGHKVLSNHENKCFVSKKHKKQKQKHQKNTNTTHTWDLIDRQTDIDTHTHTHTHTPHLFL